MARHQRQLVRAAGAAAEAQAPRHEGAPAGGALVEGAPEQRHGHPGERRDRSDSAELRAHQGPAQRCAAASARARRAAAGQQAPGARAQHVAQEEERQRRYQQEDQAVGQVPGVAARALEHRGGEDALPTHRQQAHQDVTQRIAVLEVQVQHRPKLLHWSPTPGRRGCARVLLPLRCPAPRMIWGRIWGLGFSLLC